MKSHIQALYKIWHALRRRACVSLICLLPALAAAQGKTDLTSTLTPVAPRTVAKDFALKDLDGKTQSLTGYRGKVVLINFWGSWCPPCRREMPSMERLYQTLKTEPFTVLAINQSESLDLVFAYTGEIEPAPTFPMLLDHQGEVPPQWGVRGLPASFIVDKQGRIAYRAMGGREFDHPDIEKTLRTLIAE
ncbi:MAG: TlpA family protein disulfide reductase [Gammaproteobacteria bacterium]|nr:TlpA family protein disulfide reductase [Gammaproteobacteria bacterium]